MATYRSKIRMTADADNPEEFEEIRRDAERGIDEQFGFNLERLGYALEVSYDGGETWECVEGTSG